MAFLEPETQKYLSLNKQEKYICGSDKKYFKGDNNSIIDTPYFSDDKNRYFRPIQTSYLEKLSDNYIKRSNLPDANKNTINTTSFAPLNLPDVTALSKIQEEVFNIDFEKDIKPKPQINYNERWEAEEETKGKEYNNTYGYLFENKSNDDDYEEDKYESEYI